MPLVRMTTSVGCGDLPSRPGEEVQLSPERAAQVVAAGWGEIVRGRAPETPESNRDAGAPQMETAEAHLVPRRRQVRRKTTDDAASSAD